MEDRIVGQKLPWVRLGMSLFLIVLLILLGDIYSVFQGPLEGQIAVGQLEDSATAYALSQAASSDHFILRLLRGSVLLLLAAIWLTFLPAMFRKKTAAGFLILGVGASLTTGCGPAEVLPIEEIQANETAFVVPLEGASKEGQGKFMSIEYLENAKVATKRIVIPVRKRDIGRGLGSYEWIPTLKVIKVDRTPITREWTKGHETGTSLKNEAIGVESLDSINFRVGVNATALVTEEDASKFLYYNAGRTLSNVMDTNIRGAVQGVLAREFGIRNLTACKAEKASIFQLAKTETELAAQVIGVTISSFGSAEGLLYDNPEIQASIDRAYKTEMDVATAAQEKLAQDKRNELLVAKATAERKAAEEFAKAQDAAIAKIRLEIDRIKAEATLEAAKNWKGVPPQSVVPAGSSFLFGLDTSMSGNK